MLTRDESLLALKSGLEEKKKTLKELTETLAQAEDQYKADWACLDRTLKQIRETKEAVVSRKGFFGRIFGDALSQRSDQNSPINHAGRDELLLRMRQVEGIDTQRRVLAEHIERCRQKIGSLERSNIAAQQRRQREQEQQTRANQRLLAVKAKAAAFDKSPRDLASQIRNKLNVQTHCPYCGGELGAEMHADHIYPLSKGGLSVSSNMVFVCVACNMKKRDMTLNAFIKKLDLVREDVEKRLDQLGKEY